MDPPSRPVTTFLVAGPTAPSWAVDSEKCSYSAGSGRQSTPAPLEGAPGHAPVTLRHGPPVTPRRAGAGPDPVPVRHGPGTTPGVGPAQTRVPFFRAPVSLRSRPIADPGHAPAKPGYKVGALNRGSGGARSRPGANPGAFEGCPVHARCTSGAREPRLRPRSHPGATPVTPRRGPGSRPGAARRGPVTPGLSPGVPPAPPGGLRHGPARH